MASLRKIIERIQELDKRLAVGQTGSEIWRETDRLLADILRDLKLQTAREQLMAGSLRELSRTYLLLMREIALLSSVSHLLESSATTDALFDELPDLLRREFRADSASIMLLDESTSTLEIVGASLTEESEETSGVSIPLGEGVAGWVARYRRPWLARDTAHDRQFHIYPEAQVEPRSLLTVPICRREHLFGVLNLGSGTPQFFTQRQEQLLSMVANLLAVTIGSARLYEELESQIQLQNRELIEVRDFLENVIQTSDDVIVVFDRYQKILLVSPSVERVFGYQPQELVDSHVTTLLTEEEDFARLLKMLEEEEVLRDLDLTIPHRDGHGIPTALTVSRMMHNEEVVGYLAMIRNIERRAHLYRELARANERLRALFEASQQISSTLDINEVLGSIVQSTLSLLDADSAILLLFNEQSGELEPIAKAGSGPPTETYPTDSALGIVARQGKALLLEDNRTVRQFFPETGERIESKIVIPLSAQSEILGVLDIDSLRTERIFSQDDRNLAQSFAQQASLAVANARLYGTTHIERRRFQDLLALSRRVTPGMTLAEVLPLYCEHVVQQTRAETCRIYRCQDDEFSLAAQQSAEPEQELADVILPETELARCLREQQPQLLEPIGTDSRCRAICFPIGSREQEIPFGVLVVILRQVTLTAEEREFLQVLVLQLLSLINDIRLNAEVTQTKNYLEELIASSVDAIISTDAKGNIDLFSRGAEQMLGYTAGEILGHPSAVLVVDQEALREFLIKYLHKGENPPPYELQLMRKDRTTFWASLSISWLHDGEGRVIGSLGISKDMTAKHKLEEESLKAMQLATLTQTAVTLNDRINNPLGVILNNAEFMQQMTGEVSREQKRALNTIIKQVREIQGIIVKLKEISEPIIKNYALEGETMIDLERSESSAKTKGSKPAKKTSRKRQPPKRGKEK